VVLRTRGRVQPVAGPSVLRYFFGRFAGVTFTPSFSAYARMARRAVSERVRSSWAASASSSASSSGLRRRPTTAFSTIRERRVAWRYTLSNDVSIVTRAPEARSRRRLHVYGCITRSYDRTDSRALDRSTRWCFRSEDDAASSVADRVTAHAKGIGTFHQRSPAQRLRNGPPSATKRRIAPDYVNLDHP
jgi:hypothetical protein